MENGSKMTSKIKVFYVKNHKKAPKELPGYWGGASRNRPFSDIEFFDAFRSHFGSILGHLASFWALLAPFWTLLAPFWPLLAPFWTLLALFGAENGPATHFYRFSKIWWIWGRFWFICLTANPQTNKTTNPQTTKPPNPQTNKLGPAECALALWII